MKQFVLYTRVSTRRQGDSGLGLDAQKRDLDLYLSAYAEIPFEVVGEFQDIESGANGARPELWKAINSREDRCYPSCSQARQTIPQGFVHLRAYGS